MLIGLDYTRNNAPLNFQWIKYDDIAVNKDFAPITKAKVDAILAEGNTGHYDNTEHNSSVYVSDVINFTKNFSVSLSGRLDHYRNIPSVSNNVKLNDGFEQSYFSPKVGVVYQMLQNKIALFGNYMNGFINQAPISQPDGTQLRIRPKQAFQSEMGIKTQLLDKKLFTTLSVYQIDVSNATWTDPNNFIQQSGKQTSKGFELEIIAQFGDFSFIGGAAYNENKFTSGGQSLIGKWVQGAPKNIYNLWMEYKIPYGIFQNIRLGFGGNSVSDVFWDVANTIKIPNYTRYLMQVYCTKV